MIFLGHSDRKRWKHTVQFLSEETRIYRHILEKEHLQVELYKEHIKGNINSMQKPTSPKYQAGEQKMK